ncbi:glutamine--tRNA ligase/YqeY domain fusion protein [Hahella aquimaris]|uniref:glutamine--tRNA ligase/YqeY domain fusion protein n=1 Tax=Hahella sp. HNIBRBA332 TaxID=3015983 RepID=UPI00273B816C|nr:glutamine--tRNA ligase/YqeY domain fusion protein [Hahella sp. HNIBRBA332]WLQ15289.1 glutamine--tRNA ligase/YqeY domain fusion protein [Hahella sp. HNIBRBA332]
MSEGEAIKPNFITQIIDKDLAANKHGGKVHTRFPPEPNGYLHIGHAKSICLNFGVAETYANGRCNLRFDDTNPEKESQEYIDSIATDVKWLGCEWEEPIRHASSYFDQLFEYAIELINKGKAYVCSLTPEEMTAYRGSLKEPGKPSPYRDRSVEENLDLFHRMAKGEFADGAHVLRAKIDMASPNINMRDPILYRIRRAHHHQTGDKWCVYPMYDYTHPISDALEGITHSLCTLEFEDHRPLYDWVLDNISIDCHPQQIEFARLNLNYTVTSKRKLKKLVDEKYVEGWDDPRMPTLAGLRRRGYTPRSIRSFCNAIGVTRSEGVVDVAMLEFAIREDLNERAPRAMCVLHPLRVVITNYPEGQVEELVAPAHPQNESMGTRTVPFAKEIYIDQEDFRESANKHFKRLVLGKEVRLRNAYVIRCDEVIKNEAGEPVELRCVYDPDTLGKDPEGRKVKGVIHWVAADQAVDVEVRLYDRLFNHESPDAQKEVEFTEFLNPDSLVVLSGAKAEASLSQANSEIPYQFEREGYFYLDPIKAAQGRLVFNRTVTLRDTWAKIEAKGE